MFIVWLEAEFELNQEAFKKQPNKTKLSNYTNKARKQNDTNNYLDGSISIEKLAKLNQEKRGKPIE